MADMESLYFWTFPLIGEIGISEENGALTGLLFRKLEEQRQVRRIRQVRRGTAESKIIQETPLLRKAAAELSEYLEGRRKTFDLPLAPRGTPFQLSIWKALQSIPFGKTKTYGEIAAQTGNPKASRAVGMANNRNPIAIIIPCHRVIGADGSLTGYAGGLEVKQRLLSLEKQV